MRIVPIDYINDIENSLRVYRFNWKASAATALIEVSTGVALGPLAFWLYAASSLAFAGSALYNFYKLNHFDTEKAEYTAYLLKRGKKPEFIKLALEEMASEGLIKI